MDTPPAWFVDAFGNAHVDLVRDTDATDDPAVLNGDVIRRATQVWYAVMAHQPASTAVDAPAAVDDVPANADGPESRRVYAMVPGRDIDGNAVMTPLFVKREAADMAAPKVDCPTCAGSGGDAVMCDACMGTGVVSAPPTPPRDTGIVPDDHPLMAPLSDADRAAIDALPPMPDAALTVARTNIERANPR